MLLEVPEGVGFVVCEGEGQVVVPLGVYPAEVEVVVVVVDLGRHPRRHDEEAVGGEHQDLVVCLVTLQLQLDGDFEQDLGVLPQNQPDRFVDVTSHAPSGRHDSSKQFFRMSRCQ